MNKPSPFLFIGIDSVDIERFAQWHTYNTTTLLRIFTAREIEYCLQTPAKNAERFALRFAAREAFFKALCQLNPSHTVPFLTLCKLVELTKHETDLATLHVNWTELGNITPLPPIQTMISCTHTRTTATAIVLLHPDRQTAQRDT